MRHTDKDLLKASRALAEMVINASNQCDLSKLDEMELERIKEVAHQARQVLGDFMAGEEDDPFGGDC